MNKRVLRGVILLVIGALVLGGCANVREKFVRKKKKPKEDAFVPVLVPETYLPDDQNAVKMYGKHYTLWRTWYNEMKTALYMSENQKRKIHILTQMAKALESMAAILPAELQTGMQKQAQKMRDLVAYVDRPDFLWEESVLEKRLRLIEKDVRNNYYPDRITEQLQ